jgi:general nucleoside transport system ATP-binding protein
VSKHQLAEMMVGSELPSPATEESTVTDEVLLTLAGVTLTDDRDRDLLADISLTIHRGEIVGIAGVEGNGQAELVETIMGIRKATKGAVSLAGKDMTAWSTRERRGAGIGYIAEDRQRHGLLLDAPLWENRILGFQTREPAVHGPWINRRGARQDTQRIVDQYDVRTPSIDTLARALSGGNQQKLIVGREMSGEPILLIAAHPTRGVDVGAQADIWEHIKSARRAGLGVLLVSADLDELIGLSDTIEVLLRGRLVAEFDPNTVTPQQLGTAMTGGDEEAGA